MRNRAFPLAMMASFALSGTCAAQSGTSGPYLPIDENVPGGTRPRSVLTLPVDGPGYGPVLPVGTPPEIVGRDPALPVTNLPEAIEQAYWTNPRLLAERARTRSVSYRVAGARAQYGPQLDYSVSYGYEDTRYEAAIGPDIQRNGWAVSASAVLTQPLFAFGRLRANEDIARSQIDFQRATLRNAEQQTLSDAIIAYVLVLRDRTEVVIAAENVALLERELGDTRARLDQRESTATDLQQVETRLGLGRSRLLDAESAAASSDAVFLRVIGAPAGQLGSPGRLDIPVDRLEDAYLYAVSRNPVIAAAYARERVSRAQLVAARAELWPRADLQGRADHGTSSPYGPSLSQTELRGVIRLSGRLDSGLTQAQIREAEAANAADWRLIDAALRENKAELARAWNDWRAQEAAGQRLRTAVIAAEQALEGGLLQERAGLRTTTDVLEFARDLIEVRSSLNVALADAYIAKVSILAILGKLEQEQLGAAANAYHPDAYLAEVEGSSDFPLVTALIRSLDGIAVSSSPERPARDPSAALAVGGIEVTDEN